MEKLTGGGGGIPYKKKTEVLVGNFEKNPKNNQDPVLWAWLEIFSSLSGTNRPFYRYGGHLEFRGNYGMPRGQMRNN